MSIRYPEEVQQDTETADPRRSGEKGRGSGRLRSWRVPHAPHGSKASSSDPQTIGKSDPSGGGRKTHPCQNTQTTHSTRVEGGVRIEEKGKKKKEEEKEARRRRRRRCFFFSLPSRVE